MKRVLSLLPGIALCVFFLAACEGDMGPAGPAGGDGQDAVMSCVECHNNDPTLVAVEMQYAQSMHWLSPEWTRNGNQSASYRACMECHCHNGFITAVIEGQALPMSYDDQAPINCRTCHRIHTEFTADDYGLTTVAAVALKLGGTFDVGQGNLCANCHQGRPINPLPVLGGPDVTINNRFGTHYSPQANVLAAAGPLEFSGETAYPATNGHAAACNDCHMVAPAVYSGSYQAGGHVFVLRWGDNGQNEMIAACTECHGTAVASFDSPLASFTSGVQTTISGLLAELRLLLEGEGIIDVDALEGTYTVVAGTYAADVAAAFLNHEFFHRDGSRGLHNPRYARAVLLNTIAALEERLPPP